MLHTILLLLAIPRGAGASNDFLGNWIGETAVALKHQTLLDLALPGTHDTLTYDLSTVISDGGIDGHAALAAAMHIGSSRLPNLDALEFARKQAQTQVLNITAQLDAGVRFLDFRVMYTGAAGNKDWYSLHMLQSNELAMNYFHEVRSWLDAHPTELVVLWLSKHGSECAVGQDAFPGVSPATKQTFWRQIENLFAGLLFNSSVSSVNATSVPDLVARSHRAIFWVSDYEEFTGSAQTALDGCNIDNSFTSSVAGFDLAADVSTLAGASAQKAADKAASRFYLLSMANSPPGSGARRKVLCAAKDLPNRPHPPVWGMLRLACLTYCVPSRCGRLLRH
jgi:hypothetical protein